MTSHAEIDRFPAAGYEWVRAVAMKDQLRTRMPEFVQESWAIEGIPLTLDEPSPELLDLVEFHVEFLLRIDINVKILSEAALRFTNGKGLLRSKKGMNVRVGDYRCPPGGRRIGTLLLDICDVANRGHDSALSIHHQLLNLHPFLDGNGRTSRLVWAWMMIRRPCGWDFRRTFLHEFYYQTLAEHSPRLES